MFSRLATFLTKKAGFLTNTRKIQQEADALRVLIISEYYRRNLGSTTTNSATTTTPTPSTKVTAYTIDELLDATPVGQVSMREWLSDLSHDEVLACTQRNLHQQVVHLFRNLHQVHQKVYSNANANANASVAQPQHMFQVEAPDAPMYSKINQEQENSNAMHTLLQESCGFCLQVRASQVSTTDADNAKEKETVDGVFLNGTARAGSVLGFFPGVTYLRDRVHAGDFKLRLDERAGQSDYVYMRPDRSLVDGSQRVGVLNAFAVGHLVRHPSMYSGESGERRRGGVREVGGGGASARVGGEEGERSARSRAHLVAAPNVMTFPFDYPIEDGKESSTAAGNVTEVSLDVSSANYFPVELRPYIPNAYHTPPGMLAPESAKQSFAQGAVIVALNDLQDGDEIFCDYRLNPNIALPKWYCPVDDDRSNKYWGAGKEVETKNIDLS